VTTRWREWKIHSKITEVLVAEDLHPLYLMQNDYRQEGSWPHGETYLPLAVDAVAKELFGDESLDISGRLAVQYRILTQQLVQRTWSNIHKQTKRNRNRLGALEDAATRAFKGEGSFSFWLVVFEFHRRLRHGTFLSCYHLT
jgi:hypothetical protein